MEFIFTDILNEDKLNSANNKDNLDDTNKNSTENENPKISFFYKFKKISKNQKIFIKSFMQKILKNESYLYEFPPTLDKNFLICSTLISCLNFQKEKNKKNSHTKYLLLVKNQDLIFEALNNFKEISEISKFLKKENHKNQIVPFFDKKIFCINEKATQKMSPIDFDSFCGQLTNSFVPDSEKCSAFKNFNFFQQENFEEITKSIETNLFNTEKISQQNISTNSLQQNLNNTIGNLKNFSKINISYENLNENLKEKEKNYLKSDVFSLMNQLGEVNICPFFYFSGIIRQGSSDIIIATYKDFFDPKQRIKISNLIPKESLKDYKIIFDDCGDLENLIVDYFSFQIDNNILQFASDQLFKLQEINTNELNNLNSNNNNKENSLSESDFDKFPENEFIELNGFTRNFLENRIVTVKNFCRNFDLGKELYKFFPGQIRSDKALLNFLMRILFFFSRTLSYKDHYVTNLYTLETFLSRDNIDLRTLKGLLPRFLLFLNSKKISNLEHYYNLINFIFYLSYCAFNNNGFILSYEKYKNSDSTYLEFSPIEIYKIISKEINNFNSFDKDKENYYPQKPIFLSGAIGHLEIFKKINLSDLPYEIKSQTFLDDRFDTFIKNLHFKNSEENFDENILAKEIEILKENISNLNIKLKNNRDIDSKDFFHQIYYANISNTNVNNKTFSGEILVRLCKYISDGIIVYFSNENLMEDYLKIWNEQNVFDSILNDKLVFIEEADSQRLGNVIINFKKSCDSGRGGILFLTMRNKAAIKKFDVLQGNYSKALVFIGFPIETKINKRNELFTNNLKKKFDIEIEEYLNYDTFRNFVGKISDKILNCCDRKVLLILDEKLISDKFVSYLPPWIKRVLHNDFDKISKNTEERIKKAQRHLEFGIDVDKL